MKEPRRIRLWVSGQFRWIPSDMWNSLKGPKPPYMFENDGCSFSPDTTTTGEVLWPACVIHDWHYHHGPSLGLSRAKADAILRKNIGILLKMQGVGWWRRQWYAWTRWAAVRYLGGDHYDG